MANRKPAISGRVELGGDQFAIFPGKIHPQSAACEEAFDFAIGPSRGQGGEQANDRRGIHLTGIGLALQQHFSNAGCTTEIAIDLEGGMEAEQVRRRACAAAVVAGLAAIIDRTKQHREQFVGAVAIVQSSPEIDFPSKRPSGAGVAAVSACMIMKNRQVDVFRPAAKLGAWVILVSAVLVSVSGDTPMCRSSSFIRFLSGPQA